MATILKGAPVVAAMNERNAALCEQLKAKGITPTLAVVRVGEREDDLSYERGVIARCGKVGVEVKAVSSASRCFAGRSAEGDRRGERRGYHPRMPAVPSAAQAVQ